MPCNYEWYFPCKAVHIIITFNFTWKYFTDFTRVLLQFIRDHILSRNREDVLNTMLCWLTQILDFPSYFLLNFIFASGCFYDNKIPFSIALCKSSWVVIYQKGEERKNANNFGKWSVYKQENNMFNVSWYLWHNEMLSDPLNSSIADYKSL